MEENMNILIMSDIHGNLQALQAVLSKVSKNYDIQACMLLGDLIDYGMHSNEVIGIIRNLPYPVLCSLRGNHEQAILCDEYDRFSSERGKESARYTRSILSKSSMEYLQKEMAASGKQEVHCDGRRFLAVHGSLKDEYWVSIQPGKEVEAYGAYDYVLSGHSHYPHFMEAYYKAEDSRRRNKKKVIFINPGSVGQPRNLNPMAQFAVLDTAAEAVILDKAAYDIAAEQAAYNGQVDEFYKERLEMGV